MRRGDHDDGADRPGAGDRRRELVAYLKTGSGRQKVMFGTNYPMILPAHALEGLDDPGFDQETRELYFAGNARRVFGL